MLQCTGRRLDLGDLENRRAAAYFVSAELQILENPRGTFLGARKRSAQGRKVHAVAQQCGMEGETQLFETIAGRTLR